MSETAIVDVVVGICTCKRPGGLLNLLSHIEALDYDGNLSVIVVDNDAGLEGQRASESLTRYRWPLMCIAESTPGIAYARNRIVIAALQQQPRFIAMLDDDEWPATDWLKETLRIQEQNNSDAVSGPVIPVFPENSHPWSNMPEYYGSDQDLPDGSECILYASGNFVVRASCFQAMLPEPFDPVISKTGADDMVFFLHLNKLGFKMHWAAHAFVEETVAPERLSLDWLKRRHIRTGNTNVIVQRMFAPGIINETIRWIKTLGLLMGSSLLYLLTFWHPRWRLRSTLLFYKGRGKLIGHMGRLKDYLDHGG